MRLAANNVLGSKWTILDYQKLGPKPQKTPVKVAKERLKTGSVSTKNRKENTSVGILNRTLKGTLTTASTRHTIPLGNFRFSPEVTVQNNLLPIDETTSNTPWAYDTFVNTKTAPLD